MSNDKGRWGEEMPSDLKGETRPKNRLPAILVLFLVAMMAWTLIVDDRDEDRVFISFQVIAFLIGAIVNARLVYGMLSGPIGDRAWFMILICTGFGALALWLAVGKLVLLV